MNQPSTDVPSCWCVTERIEPSAKDNRKTKSMRRPDNQIPPSRQIEEGNLPEQRQSRKSKRPTRSPTLISKRWQHLQAGRLIVVSIDPANRQKCGNCHTKKTANKANASSCQSTIGGKPTQHRRHRSRDRTNRRAKPADAFQRRVDQNVRQHRQERRDTREFIDEKK
jgi:hypothetical protein